ncbi:SEO1 [Candida jiufengensis]|uniref:SEO1 n=1 Tax=Candida jiufengensis TaxID=497108 RepID=UPI0022253EAF|nr:SEO1 [Candida jiufengensis]KAI5954581.1 SEO1 [Candida jiufengensis]
MSADTPLKRLKWGFLPQRRIIDEDENGNFINIYQETDKSSSKDENSEKDSEININEKDNSEVAIIEYRDEKDRKWWKFFDEYEYRVNTKVKDNRKWYHWFHEDDTKLEKKLITKLDILLCFYSLLAYWIKYLDTVNLVNGYIAGMPLPPSQGGINMVGNDLIDTQVLYNIGNVVFQLPFMYCIYAYPLSYVLPAMDIGWSILTVLTAEVKNTGQLQAVRFLVGVLEAPFYPAYHYLLASWYRASTGELARRAGFFYLGQYMGILTSGLISGGIERIFGDVPGETWRWIFRIDGILSLIVGIIGFYAIPGTPADCYSIFLTDDEIRAARRRSVIDNVGFRPRHNVFKEFFDLKLWKSIFSNWHLYVLSIWSIFLWSNASGPSGSYALWLQSLTNADGSLRFVGEQLQTLTSLTPALGLIYLVFISSFADLFKSRWGAIVISQLLNFTGNLMLTIWNLPEGAKWFAWCLQYFSWSASPINYSFQGDICRFDHRSRSVLLVSMNIVGQTCSIWISKLIWPTVEAPRYLKGFSTITAFTLMLIVWTMLVLYLYKRQERENAIKHGMVVYNSKVDGEIKNNVKKSSE